jgi:AraC-like DNA-binding protein
MQELDDEAPGWFRRRLPWGSYGLLARASTDAPTLGVALARWCRHHRLLTDDVRLTLAERGGLATMALADDLPTTAPREFALLSLLRNVHGLASWWVDAPIVLREAAFPFAAPPHAQVYAALFPGPVVFGAPQAALRFDAHYLAQPLRRDSAAVSQMLRRALPILVWPYRRDERLVSRGVRQLLAQPNAAHTAETLATRLGLSPRSLHRRLHAEGTSLQALKNEARRACASELLLRTHLPIARVARAAGFASDKSFARAFRQWTGQTPQAHRLGVGQK